MTARQLWALIHPAPAPHDVPVLIPAPYRCLDMAAHKGANR